MKLLLRSDVNGVGKKGDVVEVADGFGRNYLLPKGFAVLATRGGEAQAASMRRSRDQRDAADRSAASSRWSPPRETGGVGTTGAEGG